MADMFTQKDAQKLFSGKNIYLFGDSNMRSLYKDLICLLHKGTLIDNAGLRTKLESTFLNDRLIRKSRLHSGRDFIEERQYVVGDLCMEYKFITRCWCDVIENFLEDCERKVIQPDVIIMNSCLWDISRWGPNGVNEYKDNILKLLKRLHKVLPQHCVFIWTTTLPVASKCRAAFLVEQVDFLKHSLHFDVMEANVLVKDLVTSHGFDVLDVYHHLRMQTLLRNPDGIHWRPIAIRLISNLVMTHICLSWNSSLPGRVNNLALSWCFNMDNIPLTNPTVKLPVNIYNPEPDFNPTRREVTSVVSRVQRNKPYSRNNNDYDSNSKNTYNDFNKGVYYESNYPNKDNGSSYNSYQANTEVTISNNYANPGPIRQNRRRRRY